MKNNHKSCISLPESMDTINNFGNVLFIIKISEFEKENLKKIKEKRKT